MSFNVELNLNRTSDMLGTKTKIKECVFKMFCSKAGSTYGFILNMSLTPMLSLCLFLSLTSLSLVQVMWTRSGAAPAALSFIE